MNSVANETGPKQPSLWWLAVVLGLVTLGVGVFFVVGKDAALGTVTVVLGIFLLVQAVVEILTAIFGKGESRGVLAVIGIVTAIAGILLVKKPFETLTVLVLILGIVFIVAGIARFVHVALSPEGRALNFLVCLVDVAAGLLILFWPDVTLSVVAVILGIVLIVRGVVMIGFGFQVRSDEKQVASAVSPLP